MGEQYDKKLSLTIVLDISGSMVENSKDMLLDNVYSLLVSKLSLLKDQDINVSLLTFSNDVKIEYEHIPLKSLPSVNYTIGGQSNFSKIIDLFVQKNSLINDRDTVVILTDGSLLDSVWDKKWKNIIEEYALNVFVVKIGHCASTSFLKKLVNGEKNNIFDPENIVNIPFIHEPSVFVEVERYNNFLINEQNEDFITVVEY